MFSLSGLVSSLFCGVRLSTLRIFINESTEIFTSMNF